MITPTVGRVVLYTPSKNGSPDNCLAKGSGKLAAIITHVWSDTCVNLAMFDANGEHYNRTSVLLIQEGSQVPDGGFYCEWMPYQKGQAAKTEQLENQLSQAKPQREGESEEQALGRVAYESYCHKLEGLTTGLDFPQFYELFTNTQAAWIAAAQAVKAWC